MFGLKLLIFLRIFIRLSQLLFKLYRKTICSIKKNIRDEFEIVFSEISI